MKKLILTFLFVPALTIAFAQKIKEGTVPDAVKQALTQMYPNAKDVDWEMEDGNYEGEFDNNKVETSVVFTPAGAHVMTEIEISTTELPAGVHTYVKNTLGGKKITEAAKMTTAAGVVSYEAEVGGKDYIFDANGNYLSTEIEKDGEDDDDKK